MRHKRINRNDRVSSGVTTLSSSVLHSEFLKGGPVKAIRYNPSECDTFTIYSRKDNFLKVRINDQDIEIF